MLEEVQSLVKVTPGLGCSGGLTLRCCIPGALFPHPTSLLTLMLLGLSGVVGGGWAPQCHNRNHRAEATQGAPVGGSCTPPALRGQAHGVSGTILVVAPEDKRDILFIKSLPFVSECPLSCPGTALEKSGER